MFKKYKLILSSLNLPILGGAKKLSEFFLFPRLLSKKLNKNFFILNLLYFSSTKHCVNVQARLRLQYRKLTSHERCERNVRKRETSEKYI